MSLKINPLQILAEKSYFMIFSFDSLTGRMEYMNNSSRTFLDLDRINSNFSEFLKQIDTKDKELILNELKNVEETSIEKMVIKLKKNEKLYFLSLNFYHSLESGYGKIIALIDDITDEIEFQHNILTHNAKKNAILNILSHDIAGSLSTINNLVDYSVRQAENDDQASLKSALKGIKDIGSNNMSLIRSFLKKEFLTTLGVPLNFVKTDLVKCLQGFLEQYMIREPELGVKFRFITDSPSISIELDEDKFIQVINNLLSNSLKFTPEGGEITISVKNWDEKVLVSIRDTGIGIPDNLKTNLFDKFNPQKRLGLHGESSHGMGLWIVKTVVEWMGGTIDFESNEQNGTVFNIQLPKFKIKI